jgi:hypothetical protein
MNVLGSLPAQSSAQFSVNSLDFLKALRSLLVLAATLLIAKGPVLLGYSYIIHGVDYTWLIVPLLYAAMEIARRWLTGQKKPAAG